MEPGSSRKALSVTVVFKAWENDYDNRDLRALAGKQ
jgi:hypothetical protein